MSIMYPLQYERIRILSKLLELQKEKLYILLVLIVKFPRTRARLRIIYL